jgi:hypothetical protein
MAIPVACSRARWRSRENREPTNVTTLREVNQLGVGQDHNTILALIGNAVDANGVAQLGRGATAPQVPDQRRRTLAAALPFRA